MATTHPEPKSHTNKTSAKLNTLRAAVLGANDGIVSVAGIVVGVAGATSSKSTIFTAGLAGLAAGALSMAAGEYVSVSSQRDTERAILHKEKIELRDYPKEELQELQEIYEARGLTRKTAKTVAKELTAHDAFAAHAEAELSIDPHDLTNPWQAALASASSFLVGAVIPLIAIEVLPDHVRIPLTFIAVLLALTVTGLLSAIAGGADKVRSTLRVVIGGALAMAVTYSIGKLVGTAGI
jgi:VIT1/CCC1 family predicted Fe2+/Mn2+ transporter